jgi:predicted unusual protein kinase regulating ubiquinone biosynthesis (AarF/ABC1/UbiB family)
MNTIDNIPTGKISRAAKLVQTGVKVGGNYLKYYGEKLIHPDLNKDKLNEANAGDIYDGLKSLKGSALKAAQMLSMEKNLLPTAYIDKFSLSQFSVPPLSGPLVNKTFLRYFGKTPYELFDSFNDQAINAASIGQVHQAMKDGKKLAVKIQYPGVADSISSDLAIVKPIAIRMFNLKGADSEKYFKEVENKLKEETDYILEIEQSKTIASQCANIEHLHFPKYYEQWSCDRILTMDWMEGVHLSDFNKTNKDQALANSIGQTLWDFYMFQIHQLRKVHADPHPGNFLVSEQNELIAIDFGCMKEVPSDFYAPYFVLAQKENIENTALFEEKLYALEVLLPTDTEKEKIFFKELFYNMLSLFTLPLNQATFDFSDSAFFTNIATLGESYARNTDLLKMNNNRGSKHFLYINRTFFGLYNLLHDLKATIDINGYKKYLTT